MTVGQAQHCIICGSPGIVMENDQTLCLPCATPVRNEDGELKIEWTCGSCFTEGAVTERESGFRICNSCWWDEDLRDPEDIWL